MHEEYWTCGQGTWGIYAEMKTACQEKAIRKMKELKNKKEPVKDK